MDVFWFIKTDCFPFFTVDNNTLRKLCCTFVTMIRDHLLELVEHLPVTRFVVGLIPAGSAFEVWQCDFSPKQSGWYKSAGRALVLQVLGQMKLSILTVPSCKVLYSTECQLDSL
jgi:hypothetical protein